MNNKLESTNLSGKTKWTAILLVIFFGVFGWLYTIKKSAPKFIIGFFVLLTLYSTYLITEFIFFLWLFFLSCFAMWLWALIDTSSKPDSFYENYPN